MPANDALIALLSEILEGAGAFRARRMFGGHGLYLDGQFFAILDEGTLYFKVCDATRPRFEREGMVPFTYKSKTGEHALTSYRRVPERLLDEPDEMRLWIAQAVGAARAAARDKASRPAKRATKSAAKTQMRRNQ